MKNKHAFLSASGAPAWTRCEVKPWREKDLPNETSEYAEEGTEAHLLLEGMLDSDAVFGYPDVMVNYVSETRDLILELAEGAKIYPEQRLDISFITGEEGAEGTADAVIVKDGTLIVVDLKYGYNKVSAENNAQLLIYGAAAIEKFDVLGDIKSLQLVISQPRISNTSKWLLSVQEVNERISKIREIGERILVAKGGENLRANPGEVQCSYCKLSATCPERRGSMLATVANDFVDLDNEDQALQKIKNAEAQLAASDDKYLATCMDMVDTIEQWCGAVRKEVYKRLSNDNFTSHKYKLVQGRQGHRKLGDVETLVRIAKEQGIEDSLIFDKVTMSPAQLEKIHKKEHPVFWAKVQPLITRSEGKPSVVPQSDERPALNVALDFQPLDDEDTEYIEGLAGLKQEE